MDLLLLQVTRGNLRGGQTKSILHDTDFMDGGKTLNDANCFGGEATILGRITGLERSSYLDGSTKSKKWPSRIHYDWISEC